MRHLFILVLLLTIITLNSLNAAPLKPFGKDEVEVENVKNNFISVNISEEVDIPLAIYLIDKKSGEQLNYKFWKPGRPGVVKYDVSNYHLKSYTVVVKAAGEVILKKNVN